MDKELNENVEEVSMDDIDSKLLDEFDIEVEEEEVDEPNTDESVEEEVDEVDESSEGEEEPNTPDFENDKQHQAFAQMRVEAKQAQQQAQQYQEIMKILMNNTDFQDESAFIEAVRQAEEQRQMEAEGHNEQTFAKQKELLEKEQQLQAAEQQMQQYLFMEQATKFNQLVSESSEKYGVKPEEIFKRLEDSGFTSPEELVAMKNQELLIKGVLVDEIASYKQTQAQEKAANRPAVNSDPLYSNNEGLETSDNELDQLLKMSLDENLR